MVTILQKDSPILRKTAREVTAKEFGSAALKKIVEDMAKALEKEEDGVAIAAPQIGVSKRIFVVSHRAFEAAEQDFDNKKSVAAAKNKSLPADGQAKKLFGDMVCVNPLITSMSKDRKLVPEGCLSVRWLYGNTRRASRVTLKAQDADGKEFTMVGSNLLAQIFQHEVDHLDGILFTDHAKDVRDMPPEAIP